MDFTRVINDQSEFSLDYKIKFYLLAMVEGNAGIAAMKIEADIQHLKAAAEAEFADETGDLFEMMQEIFAQPPNWF
jgi:hypothetical protein